MRIAMLIVGTVVGLLVAGWFAAMLAGVATKPDRTEKEETLVLTLGIMTLTWLFGVAFTWGHPAWARPCYVLAVLCGISTVMFTPPRSPASVTSLVFAGIAGALIVMSYRAESELHAKTEQERRPDPD